MSFKSDARWVAQTMGVDYLWWRVKAKWTKVKNRRNV